MCTATLQECSDFWLMLHNAELQLRKLEKEVTRPCLVVLVALQTGAGCHKTSLVHQKDSKKQVVLLPTKGGMKSIEGLFMNTSFLVIWKCWSAGAGILRSCLKAQSLLNLSQMIDDGRLPAFSCPSWCEFAPNQGWDIHQEREGYAVPRPWVKSKFKTPPICWILCGDMTWMEPEIQLLQRRAENPNEKYIGVVQVFRSCSLSVSVCGTSARTLRVARCFKLVEEILRKEFLLVLMKSIKLSRVQREGIRTWQTMTETSTFGILFSDMFGTIQEVGNLSDMMCGRISPSRAVGREDTWWWFSIVVAGSHQLELE